MRNAKGQTLTLPTPLIVEAIRRSHITRTVAVKDKTTGEPAGVALFTGTTLRLILSPAEKQAVSDLLTVNEMEALLNPPSTDTQKGA